MRGAIYEEFGSPLSVRVLPDPTPVPGGAVLRVEATGLCLSDWHGWKGHDPDIVLPHVPGHELSGVVEAVGGEVATFRIGARVTLPFVCGCGRCPQCLSGNHQVCDHQFQPGFSAWGSFAEYVAIDHADTNLVCLPEEIDHVTAALLGCRFVTAYRALRHQGRLAAGEWVAVHGCGGVGLSAVMIAAAFGARVVAVDLDEDKLALARSVGAEATLNASGHPDVGAGVAALSEGGAHMSIDAFGSATTCLNSVASLRKRGRHVQVGLVPRSENQPRIPVGRVVAEELEILGSHGMQAHRYEELFEFILEGRLDPSRLIQSTVDLTEGARLLTRMDRFEGVGVTVIDAFGPPA